MSEYDDLKARASLARDQFIPARPETILALLRELDEARAMLMSAYDLVQESIAERQYDYEARAKLFVRKTMDALAGGEEK